MKMWFSHGILTASIKMVPKLQKIGENFNRKDKPIYFPNCYNTL
jgi:hypothetical protein